MSISVVLYTNDATYSVFSLIARSNRKWDYRLVGNSPRWSGGGRPEEQDEGFNAALQGGPILGPLVGVCTVFMMMVINRGGDDGGCLD